MDPNNTNIIWLSPQELDARRLEAETQRQLAHGTRFSDPAGMDVLMEKYLCDRVFDGIGRRGQVRSARHLTPARQ
jgi:hypothetical protein